MFGGAGFQTHGGAAQSGTGDGQSRGAISHPAAVRDVHRRASRGLRALRAAFGRCGGIAARCKNGLVAGALGVTVSAAMKTLSDMVKISGIAESICKMEN